MVWAAVAMLPNQTHVKAEDAFVVEAGLVDGKRKVKGQRRGPECRNRDAKSRTGRDSKGIGVQFNTAFDCTKVAKQDSPESIIGRDREHVLDGVEPLEFATDADDPVDAAANDGAGTPKVKSSQRRVTTGEKVFEDGRVAAGETQLSAVGKRLLSTSVGPGG